tara:strand:+ start:1078 stop:1977 length:900 start_codon:yes stop_codon:yes gene_type:complete
MAKKRDIFSKKNKITNPLNIPGQEKMIKHRIIEANQELGIKGNIVSLDPNDMDTWIIRDRAEFELGNLDELAISIKNKGQAQPIVVVNRSNTFSGKNNDNSRYIVIAGYRRWNACKKHGLKIETVIKDFTFDQAVTCLEAENEKENVSEYSKGLFYSRLKNEHNYTLDKLSKQLGVAISKLNRYISFSKVPTRLWENVIDMSIVSSRTSSEILQIIHAEPESIEFMISIADKIRSGYGHTRIKKLYSESKQNKVKQPQTSEIITASPTSIKINLKDINIGAKQKLTMLNEIQIIVNRYK